MDQNGAARTLISRAKRNPTRCSATRTACRCAQVDNDRSRPMQHSMILFGKGSEQVYCSRIKTTCDWSRGHTDLCREMTTWCVCEKPVKLIIACPCVRLPHCKRTGSAEHLIDSAWVSGFPRAADVNNRHVGTSLLARVRPELAIRPRTQPGRSCGKAGATPKVI